MVQYERGSEELSEVPFRDVDVNEQGHMIIGGCDAVELARTYGTPLYVLDEDRVRQACRAYRDAFSRYYPRGLAVYAGKALLTTGVCRIVAQEGMGLDVVSGGELYTALAAGFPPDRIYFHGNNKSVDELRLALSEGVGRIVVDNLGELELLEALAREQGRTADILLRITPGVEAHTHTYIRTGQLDSKFGIPIAGGQGLAAARRAAESARLRLVGYHCHIGSQIFDLSSYEAAIVLMMEFLAEAQRATGVAAKELDLGGGLGIRYTAEDRPPTPEELVRRIADVVRQEAARHGIAAPALALEPGRSIVGEAGVTLYTIGFVKRIPGVRTYAAVDGGMADNPRVALYQARYEAVVANKANQPRLETVTIAGKSCESGDVLIRDLEVPPLESGDVLAVLSTGAYNYSMASNYNRFPRPAMVLVSRGRHDLLVARETYADLIRHDRIPRWLEEPAGEVAEAAG
ncbi:MAG: diaminopimelate decarboxylase [Firmicutes bacterium]|nr:diaminopimelate decarboxylase [Bacillota bacterium]